MSAAALLDRLEGVRSTGSGRWLARCSAHEDRSPSLSIRELDDGRVLVYCFARCEVEDIVSAVGLSVSDLFPDRPLTQTAFRSSPFKLKAHEALLLLGHEAFVAALLVDELAELVKGGGMPSDIGISRLVTAVARIQTVRSFTEEITPPELKAIRRGEAA